MLGPNTPEPAVKPNILAAPLFTLLLISQTFSAAAQDGPEADADVVQKALLSQLNLRQGDFVVTAANATVHVKDGFHYLDAGDSQKVLEQLWGNPPDDSILGMLVPDDVGLVGPHSWAVALTYSDDGYVSDEDAASIDYNDLLKDMQKSTSESNDAREEAGYGRLDLVGWATPPRYDAQNKKLHWAKELAFSGAEENTLNYDVRALGRGGYLSMNAIASISDLDRVKTGMEKVMTMTEFNAGQRYADFDSSSDKVAGYGLAALVGGAIAAKTGLFAKLLVALMAAKKFIILGLVAAGAAIKKFFGKKEQQP